MEVPLGDMLTSELVFRLNDLTDEFGVEYKRRLELLGLSPSQIEAAFASDRSVFSDQVLNDQLDRAPVPWYYRGMISLNETVATLIPPASLAMSELIAITDEANSLFWRHHEHASDSLWEVICTLAATAVYTKAVCAYAFKDRAVSLGWTEKQAGAFVRNECLILERLKWDMHNEPAWTDMTVQR